MTVATFAIVAGVLAFWLILLHLVRRDGGDVGIDDVLMTRLRLIAAITRATHEFGDALTPAFRALASSIVKTERAFRAFADAFELATAGRYVVTRWRRRWDPRRIVVSGPLPFHAADDVWWKLREEGYRGVRIEQVET